MTFTFFWPQARGQKVPDLWRKNMSLRGVIISIAGTLWYHCCCIWKLLLTWCPSWSYM
jgi:hypothetical protein